MNVAWAAEAVGGGGRDGGYWQLALVLAGIGFLGLFARWRKARTPALPSAKEMRARDDNPNRYRDAADKAIVELLETSRVLNAQVDTKIRVLNRLVKEAEEKMAGLERLLETAGALESGELQVKKKEGSAAPESGDGNVEAPAAAVEDSSGSGRRFLSDLHEIIHRLHGEGKSVADIAKVTKLSTTEVEFIVKTL